MDKALERELKRFLDGEDDLVLALVFGSVATGRARPGSDLDIAVAGLAPMGSERLADLALGVSRLAGREVDILDLREAHGTILERILAEGVPVLMKSRQTWEEILRRHVFEEADFMPLYRRLLKERRERFLGQ